jgi:hypothetical protein
MSGRYNILNAKDKLDQHSLWLCAKMRTLILKNKISITMPVIHITPFAFACAEFYEKIIMFLQQHVGRK